MFGWQNELGRGQIPTFTSTLISISQYWMTIQVERLETFPPQTSTSVRWTWLKSASIVLNLTTKPYIQARGSWRRLFKLTLILFLLLRLGGNVSNLKLHCYPIVCTSASRLEQPSPLHLSCTWDTWLGNYTSLLVIRVRRGSHVSFPSFF